MKYMLMMSAPRGTGDYQIFQWPKGAFDAHIEFMRELNKELHQNGELVGGEGLTPPGQAKLVRADRSGKPVVTDGPFPESKEFLAGYWIVDVDTPERAYAIAGRASAAPGPDGKPMNMAIEVRAVMAAPPPFDG